MRRLSSAARGREYELRALEFMTRHGLQGTRVGGAGDRGVDIRGAWHLPAADTTPLAVVAQCKALRTVCGPGAIQAFESVVAREQRVRRTLGIVFSESGFENPH